MKCLKSFFYSQNKFQPVYFWTTVFILLIIVSFTMRLLNIGTITDELLLGLMGFVGILLGIFNFNEASRRKHNGGPSEFPKGDGV